MLLSLTFGEPGRGFAQRVGQLPFVDGVGAFEAEAPAGFAITAQEDFSAFRNFVAEGRRL